jgi:hypothetical protein
MKGRYGAAPKGRPLVFRTMRFLGLIIVLALVLGAPPVSAAGSREPEGVSVRGVVSALWKTFIGLIPVSGLDAVSAVADDPSGGPGDPNGGPIMDPNGKPPGP